MMSLKSRADKGRIMEQKRAVQTPDGQIEYFLVRKNVKNLNLRIRPDGTVVLSVPVRCKTGQADGLIAEKSSWILSHQRQEKDNAPLLPEESASVCEGRLKLALDRVYPLVERYGIEKPALKIRTMRAQWGNCHWAQGYITLNRMLYRCPEHLREYVALHELIHFLHHDHGAGFYAVMDELMPDWKQRRKELKRFAAALRNEI